MTLSHKHVLLTSLLTLLSTACATAQNYATMIKGVDSTLQKAATFFHGSHFSGTQPIEDALYVLGTLTPASKKIKTAEGVQLKINLFNNHGQSLSGQVTSMQEGRYAFRVPNCEGYWTMLLNATDADGKKKYRIAIDRQFSPAPRLLSPQETVVKAASTTAIPLQQMEEEEMIAAENSEKGKSMTEKVHQLRNVTIKKKRSFDRFTAWENEQRAKFWADIYYNVDKETDRLLDSGHDTPEFFRWLSSKNRLFNGTGDDVSETTLDATGALQAANEEANATETAELTEALDQLNAELEKLETEQKSISNEAPYYKNRPIVWIINNRFYALTGITPAFNKDKSAMASCSFSKQWLKPFPVEMEEVKSVYISENPNAFINSLPCQALKAYSPVTVFIYVHHYFTAAGKGQRRTMFSGYDVTEPFFTPDYRILPKEEDYRRTLYWNPSVTADKQGNAVIEFSNSTTCQQISVSAEGLTPQLQPAIYQQP